MFRCFVAITMLCMVGLPAVAAETISGHYLEARTCQVYTGPCFANGEIGLAGKEAVMAWKITQGKHQGVDLAGLKVVMVVSASETLAFGGIDDVASIKSLIMVDDRASDRQRDALVSFARQQSGKAGKSVVRVDRSPIEMKLDTQTLKGQLNAGDRVKLLTRKARPGDCICSNESAYYPTLAKVTNFAPGVTIEGSCNARGLGTRWTIPDSRSAYMATFEHPQ